MDIGGWLRGLGLEQQSIMQAFRVLDRSLHGLRRTAPQVAMRRTLTLRHGAATRRFRRVSPVAPRPREGPLTKPIAGAQPRRLERVLMPHSSHLADTTRIRPGR